jgi:hypothetical protein
VGPSQKRDIQQVKTTERSITQVQKRRSWNQLG